MAFVILILNTFWMEFRHQLVEGDPVASIIAHVSLDLVDINEINEVFNLLAEPFKLFNIFDRHERSDCNFILTYTDGGRG